MGLLKLSLRFYFTVDAVFLRFFSRFTAFLHFSSRRSSDISSKSSLHEATLTYMAPASQPKAKPVRKKAPGRRKKPAIDSDEEARQNASIELELDSELRIVKRGRQRVG